MAWIFYTLQTRDGQQLRRNGRFADATTLDMELARNGEQLVDYLRLPDLLYRVQHWLFGRLSAMEIAEFCQTLSLYIGGGVDLHSALQDLAASSQSPNYRQVVSQVHQALLKGYPLSQAMRMTHQFPEEVQALVKIGEESATLERVLNDAGAHIERVSAIRKATQQALIYPAFTLVVMLVGALFWLSFVIPKLEQVFRTINIKMPAHISTLLIIVEWLQNNVWLMLCMLLALLLAFLAGRRNVWFRYQTDCLAWHMPLMGKVVAGSQMAFWFQYLGLLYGAGLVITDSVDIMQSALSNHYFRTKILHFNAQLREGQSLQTVMQQVQVFEPLAIRMVAIGEETGKLESQMKKLATIYFARVSSLVEVLGKVIEPAMIIMMAGMLAFFVMGVLTPIYESIGSMGGP